MPLCTRPSADRGSGSRQPAGKKRLGGRAKRPEAASGIEPLYRALKAHLAPADPLAGVRGVIGPRFGGAR